MFLFSAAVLFSACLATDSFTIQKTGTDTKTHFMIMNGNLSININEKQKIIMNESQLEKQAVAGDWKNIYIPKDLVRPQDIYGRHNEKTTLDSQRNLDSFTMSRRHNAPLSYYTVQSTTEPGNDKLAGHLQAKTKFIDHLDNFVLLRQHNEPLIKSANPIQQPKEDHNRVLISSQEFANYEPMVLSIFTRVPSNYIDVRLNNESISDETTLVPRWEPENYGTTLVTKPDPGNKKPLQETKNEPNKLLHANSELKSVSNQISSKDLPKYALFVNYDLLNSSNNTELHSNENIAIPPAPIRYEQDPSTYEPVKNRHQFQPQTISHFELAPITSVKPNLVSNYEPDPYEPVKNRHQLQPVTVSYFKAASISTEKSILNLNYGPVPSDYYLPPLVSSFAIAPYQTPHRSTNTEPKPYLNNKPAPKSNTVPPPVQNYETATYFQYKPEINLNPKKISNYSSVFFGPQPMLNYEPDNLRPVNYDPPLNYEPVNYEEPAYGPRNDEPQNYETSLFSNNKPETYEHLPSKQLVYNYSHQSHLDNLQNEGEVEILDVIYDDDEHEAQIIEALNKQTAVMEKLANVIQNENRRALKLSRGEKRFNELLNEIEEWNNKTSTTPKQKQQSKNATNVTPSIVSLVDETEIRNALKVNPLVNRVLKMAARKRKEYLDAVKKYYNVTI